MERSLRRGNDMAASIKPAAAGACPKLRPTSYFNKPARALARHGVTAHLPTMASLMLRDRLEMSLQSETRIKSDKLSTLVSAQLSSAIVAGIKLKLRHKNNRMTVKQIQN